MPSREIITDVERLRSLLPATDLKFWLRVDVYEDEGCWPFLGYLLPNGYGQVKRKRCGRTKSYVTHRYAFELIYGPIPEGKKVCHDCDNPECVRPDHLWLGTQAENLEDARVKGRAIPFGGTRADNRGENHGLAKLTRAAVTEIRELWNLGEVKQNDLAKEFGVSRGTISDIVCGRSWKHLIEEEHDT